MRKLTQRDLLHEDFADFVRAAGRLAADIYAPVIKPIKDALEAWESPSKAFREYIKRTPNIRVLKIISGPTKIGGKAKWAPGKGKYGTNIYQITFKAQLYNIPKGVFESTYKDLYVEAKQDRYELAVPVQKKKKPVKGDDSKSMRGAMAKTQRLGDGRGNTEVVYDIIKQPARAKRLMGPVVDVGAEDVRDKNEMIPYKKNEMIPYKKNEMIPYKKNELGFPNPQNDMRDVTPKPEEDVPEESVPEEEIVILRADIERIKGKYAVIGIYDSKGKPVKLPTKRDKKPGKKNR